jgi:hypothetical protein
VVVEDYHVETALVGVAGCHTVAPIKVFMKFVNELKVLWVLLHFRVRWVLTLISR